MTSAPETSLDAFREIKDEGTDATIRLKVGRLLAEKPRTNSQLYAEITDHPQNSIRPRVTELVRMGCVERSGKRLNPSDKEAFVNHLTPLGHRWIRGDANPDATPPLAAYQREVVEVARSYLRGGADEKTLRVAVKRHDILKGRMDPEWMGGL